MQRPIYLKSQKQKEEVFDTLESLGVTVFMQRTPMLLVETDTISAAATVWMKLNNIKVK